VGNRSENQEANLIGAEASLLEGCLGSKMLDNIKNLMTQEPNGRIREMCLQMAVVSKNGKGGDVMSKKGRRKKVESLEEGREQGVKGLSVCDQRNKGYCSI